jgi:adenylate kinase family enzyme
MPFPQRVHIFGAAGCGSTTLGRAIARRRGCQHVDADDVFWLPTVPPYRTRRATVDRVRMLEEATRWDSRWVLSGSIVGWGDFLVSSFDLVVFLYAPGHVRLARLRARERQRFGPEIDAGGSMYERHRAFLEWAAGYDTGASSRTLETDANWLAHLPCPVVPLTGDCPTDDQVAHILNLADRLNR